MTSIGLHDIVRSAGSFPVKAMKLLDFFAGTLLARIVPPRAPRSFSGRPSSRILIIRPGGMGDAIFLLPILKALREEDPQRTISVLCEKRNAEIFRLHPHLVNNTYLYHSPKDLSALFKASYDILIDTEQWHYLSALVGYFINCPFAVGFATRPLRRKLFHKNVPYDHSAYELKNFANLFEGLTGDIPATAGIGRSFSVPPAWTSWAAQTLLGKSCAISLGAHIPQRRLSCEQISALVPALLAQYETLILMGGDDSINLAKRIMKKTGNARILNFAGRTSIMESAALLQACNLAIGSDSGLMHLSCAVGTKTLVFFGPGNMKKWAPRGGCHKTLTLNQPCSPCTVFGYTLPRCKGTFECIRNITTEQITKELDPC